MRPAPPAPKYLRAAVIGHTGKGNYGHGLDQLFLRLDGVRLAAIADADPEGLDAARSGRGRKRPTPISGKCSRMRTPISSRWVPAKTGERYEMVKAALEAGAHVCCERPIARTLREATNWSPSPRKRT